jgi:hypothetical protein
VDASIDPDAGLDAEGLFISKPNAMRTWTQRRIDPTTMTPDEVSVTDIAHGLSRQCRYNGHTYGHLSVARHCLWVAEYLGDQGYPWVIRLTGLLHDASETYIGDMIRPLKHNPALGTAFAEIEEHVEAQIAARFGLPFPYPSAIKAADDYVLTQLELGGPEHRWHWDGDARDDEAEYIREFVNLGGK